MDADELQAQIEAPGVERGFSGVCLATVAGEVAFSYATGFAHRGHRVPNTLTTRFAAASVTKMITAAAALSLVDDGRLDLLTPLIDLLPPDLLPRAVSPELTIHHLLSHTSGIASYFDEDVEDWAPYLACWDTIPTYHVRSARDLVPLFADKPALAAPGGPMHYTNANYILAGLVCEHVADAPFPTVVEEHVFARAGMTASTFAALDTEPADLAVGYLRPTALGGPWRSNIYSVPAVGLPDGGMITTAYDLTRFVEAISAGRLLSPERTEAMLIPQATYPDEPDLHYGYGTVLATADGRIVRLRHRPPLPRPQGHDRRACQRRPGRR
jgi:CubicO group peptidase (beta-lactamase class C family)